MRTGLIVVALLVVVGLTVAVAFLPLLIALGVLAALGVLCVRDEAPRRDSTKFGCARERFAVGIGIAAFVAGYAAIGTIALLGGGGATLVAAAALAVFGLRGLHRGPTRQGRRQGGASSPPSGHTARPARTLAGPTGTSVRRPLQSDPAALSVDGLCHAWRASFRLLQEARGPDELGRTAEVRRGYLDELARRHPEGFRCWLDDGAQASDDPSRYVRPRSGPEQA